MITLKYFLCRRLDICIIAVLLAISTATVGVASVNSLELHNNDDQVVGLECGVEVETRGPCGGDDWSDCKFKAYIKLDEDDVEDLVTGIGQAVEDTVCCATEFVWNTATGTCDLLGFIWESTWKLIFP